MQQLQVHASGVDYDECLEMATINEELAECDDFPPEERVVHAELARLWREAAASKRLH